MVKIPEGTKCGVCEEVIQDGDTITSVPGVGYCHVSCVGVAAPATKKPQIRKTR